MMRPSSRAYSHVSCRFSISASAWYACQSEPEPTASTPLTSPACASLSRYEHLVEPSQLSDDAVSCGDAGADGTAHGERGGGVEGESGSASSSTRDGGDGAASPAFGAAHADSAGASDVTSGGI